jgi:alkylhydroperoxidase/carboxymuconolactone decarboxylase family protein YurZ
VVCWGLAPASPRPTGGGRTSTARPEDLLRRFALNDEVALDAVVGGGLADAESTELGMRTRALVRLAAIVAAAAAPTTYQWAVHVALAAGATEEEIVAVLATVAPVVGSARVNAAAPALGRALGYEVDSLPSG